MDAFRTAVDIDNAKKQGANIAAETALKTSQAVVSANSAKKIAADTAMTLAKTPKEELKGQAYSAIETAVNSAKDAARHSHAVDSLMHLMPKLHPRDMPSFLHKSSSGRLSKFL